MEKHFLQKIKILFAVLVTIFLSVAMVVWQKYPFAVERYKTISLGMQAAEKAGDSIIWAPPYNRVPESDFYVYSLGIEPCALGRIVAQEDILFSV